MSRGLALERSHEFIQLLRVGASHPQVCHGQPLADHYRVATLLGGGVCLSNQLCVLWIEGVDARFIDHDKTLVAIADRADESHRQ